MVRAIGVLRIGQGGGTGHAAGNQATDLVEIDLAQAGDDGDRKAGDDRDQESVQDPPPASGHQGGDEGLPGAETDCGQEDADADLADHHVCAGGRVGADAPAGTEGAQDDGDDQRTAGQAEFDRLRDAREMDGDGTEDHAQGDAEEDEYKIGAAERVGIVADDLLYTADAFRRTQDLDDVSGLEDDARTCHELDAGTQDTGDLDTEFRSEIKVSQRLAVDIGT